MRVLLVDRQEGTKAHPLLYFLAESVQIEHERERRSQVLYFLSTKTLREQLTEKYDERQKSAGM